MTSKTEMGATLARATASLVEAADLVDEYAKEAGPCDHAANICFCGMADQARDLRDAAAALASCAWPDVVAQDAAFRDGLRRAVMNAVLRNEALAAAYRRKRSWRPSERAMALAGVERDTGYLRAALARLWPGEGAP